MATGLIEREPNTNDFIIHIKQIIIPGHRQEEEVPGCSGSNERVVKKKV